MLDFGAGGVATRIEPPELQRIFGVAAVRGRSPELLAADDATIDDAVKIADPMALRGLLFQLTGDEEIASTQVTTTFVGFGEACVVGDEADAALLRDKAAAFLKAWRDGPDDQVSIGPPERLPRSMCLTAGDDVPQQEFDLWFEEMGVDPFARGLIWREQPPADRLETFRVVVIGAGMAGLNAAVLLRRAGIQFTVIEKNAGVGGTWFENRYPGARVDTPSRGYLHVFGADFPYSSPFCPWHENLEYFNWVADEFDIRRNIVFGTEVTSCRWDEDSATWIVKGIGPDGDHEAWRADAIISAVGFLSRPNVPHIEGSEQFQGRMFHTARWPDDLDLTDASVAIIGTGCSGYQSFPEIALAARQAYLFQRTPQWVFPTKGYRSPFPPQVKWLDRNLPFYTNFLRFKTSWSSGPKNAGQKRIDPEWTDPYSRNAINKRQRDHCVAFMQRKFAERPDLAEKMLPPHPVWSARPVMADEEYCIYDALLLDNAELVTDPIERITPTGVETTSGETYPVDVIACATGFRANDFLWPMEVVGRDDVQVEELWAKDGPRAYLGTMLPGFPNMFLLYGPNTNPLGGLGVSQHQEMMTRYALECIQLLILDGYSSLDVKHDAYWRYNDALDEQERTMIYGEPTVNNYYRSDYGRSAANCPFPGNKMWAWLQKPHLADMVVG
jgi:4-hydroxyacetophenone monooxygenase